VRNIDADHTNVYNTPWLFKTPWQLKARLFCRRATCAVELARLMSTARRCGEPVMLLAINLVNMKFKERDDTDTSE
jgi:hypothetical protein